MLFDRDIPAALDLACGEMPGPGISPHPRARATGMSRSESILCRLLARAALLHSSRVREPLSR